MRPLVGFLMQKVFLFFYFTYFEKYLTKITNFIKLYKNMKIKQFYLFEEK